MMVPNYNNKSWESRLVQMQCAMMIDAMNNEVKFESGKVSVQDVSDCPDLHSDDLSFETCEDIMNDIAHELAMEELKGYCLAS